jgi:hypothetical protein
VERYFDPGVQRAGDRRPEADLLCAHECLGAQCVSAVEVAKVDGEFGEIADRQSDHLRLAGSVPEMQRRAENRWSGVRLRDGLGGFPHRARTGVAPSERLARW